MKIGGVPAPKAEWTLKDEPLAPSSTVIIETTEGQSTLTLKSLTGRSTGKVKVTATNVVGKASAEFDVTVKGIGLSDFAALFDLFSRFTWTLGIILAFLRSPSYLNSRALTTCDYGFEPSPALFLPSYTFQQVYHDIVDVAMAASSKSRYFVASSLKQLAELYRSTSVDTSSQRCEVGICVC